MYASFHPRQHEVWVTLSDGGLRKRFTKYDDHATDLFQTIRPLLTWPAQHRVDAAFAEANREQSVIRDLEVYRLSFNVESGELSRVLLAATPNGESR